MSSFFNKPFNEQIEEIMKMKTADLKLMQALIGIRTPVGLSLYCSTFFLTRIVTAQAKCHAYNALLNVLTEYQQPERKIPVHNMKERIEKQVSGNEDLLRQNVFLPSSTNNLKSLTNDSCPDLVSYIQETDVSSLCTLSVQKVFEIYRNYISREEIKLEDILLTAKNMEDKDSIYSYIEREKDEYHVKREEALQIVEHNKSMLLKMKNKHFFNNWYEKLLQTVVCEAEKNNKHILYGEIANTSTNSAKRKLHISFNKEAIIRVISKLLDDYIKTSPASLGIKEKLLPSIVRINIDDYKGRLNYEAVSHKVISWANELISENNVDDFVEGLQYIMKNMHVSLLSAVEQEMLNEIVKKAASHREKDSKKNDIEVLAICNGGEFQNKLSLSSDLAFSEIEHLYKDMLSIEFIEPGEHEWHTLYDRLPLLELEEIKEIFPTSVTNNILEKMEKSLEKYVEAVQKIKKEIVDKVFGKQENIEKLYKLEQELQFNFMQKFFHPFYYKEYQEIMRFVECKNFVHDNINNQKDSSFRRTLEAQLNKLDKSKHEELGRLLLSSIDNEFQEVANQLIACKKKLINTKMEQEKHASLPFHPLCWISHHYQTAEIKSLEMCEKALQRSVAAGDDELFYQAIKDIQKSSKYMWIFQMNAALFSNIYITQHDPQKSSLTFRKLAESFIGKRKQYLIAQQDEYKIRKATAEQQQINIELFSKDMSLNFSWLRMEKNNEISEKRAKEAEAKVEEVGEKLEKERRAKEEEIRAREKAEEKVEIEKAEKKALDLLYDEADDQDISRKKIKQNKDVQNFLECQYTFLVLNKDYMAKFKNLYKKYKKLKKEMKEFDFEMLPELANEFERLSRCFAEGKRRMEESRETMPECNDGNIDTLKNSIMTRAREAKDVAEEEKRRVENEKQRVEELQMKIPNSAQ